MIKKINKERKPIIAIDFDGTIVTNAFPHIGKLMPNAKDVISKLKRDGNIIILWTCREGKNLEKALDFCKEIGIEFDAINENYKYLPFNTSNKIYADYYIDDRAKEVDWKKSYEEISKYKMDPFIKE